MTLSNSESLALESVRAVERLRIQAIRANDADAMHGIIDEKFLYIDESGNVYDRSSLFEAVRTHELTFDSDVDLTETDYRIDGDLVILAGLMLGHARLDGEQQVYRLRSMRVWRSRGVDWRLLAWQSSRLWR